MSALMNTNYASYSCKLPFYKCSGGPDTATVYSRPGLLPSPLSEMI